MTPQQNRSRQYKRLLAIAGATVVAVGGTIGLAFAADSDDNAGGSDTVKSVATAPPSPAPTVGTHWPTPPAGTDSGDTTREDGGPEEGTRGPSHGDDGSCVDAESGGSGPNHC